MGSRIEDCYTLILNIIELANLVMAVSDPSSCMFHQCMAFPMIHILQSRFAVLAVKKV